MTPKKVLFVINTLGRAGAETSLLEVLRRFDKVNNSVYLYVLTGQGELGAQIPDGVTLLNKDYDESPVLSDEGKRLLARRMLGRSFGILRLILSFPYLLRHFLTMLIKGRILPDKLLWRYISDSSPVFDMEFDLAVAFLEGGSAYYTADRVKAGVKAAFIHIDYTLSGYYRSLDRDCYMAFDKVYAVSEDVRRSFLSIYPELSGRVELFSNMLDRESIDKKSNITEDLKWDDDCIKILSVGRLTAQKNYHLAIEAMALLKKQSQEKQALLKPQGEETSVSFTFQREKTSGKQNPLARIKWYVLGEGEERQALTEKIKKYGLQDSFILLGSIDNPYPYIKNCDVFVHATGYEGKSIAVEEARLLGRAIVISDTSGNHDQISDGVDGIYCSLTPEDICNKITSILENPVLRRSLEYSAADRYREHTLEHEKLVRLLEEEKASIK